MQPKAFTLLNKGMNRDLSISKAGESSAYENHNIRIIARDQDTLLSVTNERGNDIIVLNGAAGIKGELVGWNVLNNHIILFTHSQLESKPDFIYRIDYDGNTFTMASGSKTGTPLYNGNLEFSAEYPIESVVYFETEDIQKIYWVDGQHVLRFMNFMADDDEIARWDDTYFDSNRSADFGVTVEIDKDNSGNTRANGVVQYLLTYYNKHGQETGIVWVSDLVYLSPVDRGGAADGTNSNKVTLTFTGMDKSFTHYRVYSIFRSALNGTTVAYIVADGEIQTIERVLVSGTGRSTTGGTSSSGASRDSSQTSPNGTPNRPTSNVTTVVSSGATVIDDGAHLVSEDVQKLLYLGSQEVKPGTLTHKDQTLFLGDLQSIGKENYDAMESAVKSMYDSDGNCKYITFRLSDSESSVIGDIPYHTDTGAYEYDSQLNLTSSQILSFKGGEKYRFALTFRRKDGTTTEAFWIGDAENKLYPVIDSSAGKIKRIVAECTLPDSVVSAMESCGFETAQLMIAEATYADRSVKAQGILNPTMFNVWDRYNDRLYAQASWISRPRNSGFATRHFEPVHNSTGSTGEIECNYWTTTGDPTPYYRLSGDKYVDQFDGRSFADCIMMIYYIKKLSGRYEGAIYLVEGSATTDAGLDSLKKYRFQNSDIAVGSDSWVVDGDGFSISIKYTGAKSSKNNSIENLYTQLKAGCINVLGLSGRDMVDESRFNTWCTLSKGGAYFNKVLPNNVYYNDSSALNNGTNPSDSDLLARWGNQADSEEPDSLNYIPSYYRKHLMFVDENIVTLNSPELEYEAVSFDNAEKYKLRIVGIARITNTSSDYTVDATPGRLAGENLLREKFVGDTDGIISWPLWKENGLKPNPKDGSVVPEEERDRTPEDYKWSEDTVSYWLHMWNHSGKITGFTSSDDDYSRLNSKIFANLRYSYDTIYNYNEDYSWEREIQSGSLRVYNYTSDQYVSLKCGDKTIYYDANIRQSLLPPGSLKYPILYSKESFESGEEAFTDAAFLYVNSPVQMNYFSSAHAVVALPTVKSSSTYTQTVLPYLGDASGAVSVANNAIIPWLADDAATATSAYLLDQERYDLGTNSKSSSWSPYEKYLFIGEIYYDFSDNDTRYGDVQNNRFVTAGPQYTLSKLQKSKKMYANQGDTYFQRWDCLKTKPASTTDATNGVIDITSFMVETHINIDGRTDNQRETGLIASIDTAKYGQLNTVYSQQNNYFAQRDLDEDFNQDSYRSSITWTLEKADSAETDEWSHITLANTLKLDGDKGYCNALRRFQNSIIAFQDKGIAEVLFNSRTQLTTTDGVPVEIANSGKVDGKRYISNKYGCTNKWSIVEGKSALYFVDNINKAFCAFNGNITPLSSQLGFDVWFRRNNKLKAWTPAHFENFVSFYDRIHSDVYLVGSEFTEEPCLVYNENLGVFTSFFDYGSVPMMTNINDRFISFKGVHLWRQNEGKYCNFFNKQYDFWTTYRVTPDPYGDKIWTNIDYRADFYQVLDSSGNNVQPEKDLITADSVLNIRDEYKENETFSSYEIWNEYQTTGTVSTTVDTMKIDPVRKKFRIWRLAIPRALKHDTNKRGLDRIRNPWVNIRFRKEMTDNRLLMQLHDIVVKYFE